MRPGAPGWRPGRADVAGTVTYGLALQAWCVYLIAARAIPVHRVAELIEALTGAEPSPGFVHSMIARAAVAVAAANTAIRCLIILSHVICADETPIRVGPGPKTRKRYLLVACASRAVNDPGSAAALVTTRTSQARWTPRTSRAS